LLHLKRLLGILALCVGCSVAAVAPAPAQQGPVVNRVAFEGNKGLGEAQLGREIQTRPGTVFSTAGVQSDVARLVEAYRRAGNPNVRIEPRTTMVDQDRVDVVFEIIEGKSARRPRVTFVGNRQFSEATLRQKLSKGESLWTRLFTSGDRYDPDRLDYDKELLRRFYLSVGYADFRIISAVTELAPDGDGYYAVFTIEEGERYRFGKIDVTTRLAGVNVAAMRSLVSTREGEWFNADQVQRTTTVMTEATGRLGYAFADVRPVVNRRNDTRTIDLTYEIVEGPRVYVERINITGNTRTFDKVIRREFRMAEGDAFTTAKLRRTQQRLENLGYFERVEVSTRPGSAPDRTIIDVEVVEQSTGEISVGGGYSTSSGFLGDILVRERNLFGLGQDVRAYLAVGTRSTQVDLGFTEPYFLDRNVMVGADAFRITLDNQKASSYDQTSMGGVLRAGWSLFENTRQTVKYTLRHDDVRNIASRASPQIQAQRGKTWTSEVGQIFAWDTRDSPRNTTSGWLLRYSLDFGGVGGTEHYIRNKLEARYFYEIFDEVVVMIAGQGGVIKPLKDDLRIVNRYFLGGDNFRGFRLGGVGPHAGGDALGGKYYYVATAEVSFPIGLPRELGIYGKAFVDAGSLWGAEEKGAGVFDSSSLRLSTGVGLEWVSPLGPVRIDLAVPVRRERFDKTELIRFSFGTRY
jgi:outer membrane protein insertion porin family